MYESIKYKPAEVWRKCGGSPINLILIEVWRNWDVAEAPPVADEARHKEWQRLGENQQGHEAQFEP